MYKITWDKETGGVRLSSKVEAGTIGVPPRPVFFEELDLLELDKLGWCYPRCQEPLLWACNKQYFYRGQLVFEAKGANVYDKATVIFQPGMEKLSLQPVDVATMLERNKDEMFLIESEAIEFIRDTYLQYSNARKTVAACTANQLDFEALAAKTAKRTKQAMAIVKQDCDSFDIMPLDTAQQQGKKVYATTKIDKFLASFSGGKDSQVVLDLCTRAIPSTEFEVIYSDTGYELPTSLTLYEQVQAHYQEKFPDLKFSIARNHESVLNYWDQIGTPSDTHRWCCSVMKTAPLYRMLKIEGTNKQAKVLAFNGVRAEESSRRSEYERIGKGKHNNVINANPIINWNTTEIFLYIFKHELPINLAYRHGRARVGCIICPFSTSWDDMISNLLLSDELNPFLSKIINSAQKGGIKDIDNYIKDRKWKFRSSGNYINSCSSINFNSITPNLEATLINTKQDIKDWLPALGDYIVSRQEDIETGEIQIDGTTYPFSIKYSKNRNNFNCILYNVDNAQVIKLFKRILYKTTYCINCEVCEVECPTGALSVFPKINIDKTKCVHCHKCLEFHDCGCIVAHSLIITTNTNMKAKSGIDRYNTFGLKEEWIDLYFSDTQNYWNQHGLGTKQIPAMKNWLKDAEIIDNNNEITQLGQLLSKIYFDNKYLVWEIIWINIVHNSFIANWYSSRVSFNKHFSKSLLKEMIQDEFPNQFSDRTIKNAIDALIRTFKESPIGNDFNLYVVQNKESAIRHPYNDLSEIAVAYSLYKYSEMNKIKTLRVSDLYQMDANSGIYQEFGINREYFEKKLRTLNSSSNRVLLAELNMGLDHITLRDDLTAIETLKILTK